MALLRLLGTSVAEGVEIGSVRLVAAYLRGCRVLLAKGVVVQCL